jgi:hypothetical protein
MRRRKAASSALRPGAQVESVDSALGPVAAAVDQGLESGPVPGRADANSLGYAETLASSLLDVCGSLI